MKLKIALNLKVLIIVLLGLWGSTSLANTILVLGDSLSAAYRIPVERGWVNLLQERLDTEYPGSYRVVNASVSGDTTAQGLRRLPPLLEAHNPDLVIVGLGGNDGLRGLPLDQMRDNLQAIIDMSKAAGAEVILMSVELPASYGALFNSRFLGVFDGLEQANGLPRVSLGIHLLDSLDLMQEDGIHPTAEAQPLLLDAVWPVLSLEG